MNDRQARFLAAIHHQPVDRVPTHIDFTPKMLDVMCAKYGRPSHGEEELLDFMDNHLVYGFLNDSFGKMRRRVVTGHVIDFDNWGVGYHMDEEGVSPAVYPLDQEDIEEALRSYKFPDPNAPGLTDWAEMDVKKFGDEYIVCSYQVTLLLERMQDLCGFEKCFAALADPDMEETVEDFLDGITNYQCEMAKRYIKLGVQCGRTGDDYGVQKAMMVSPKMWREKFKPRLRRIVEVYKDAGLPVIHHSCGNVLPIIPDLAEIGIDVLNNVQPEAMPRKEVAKYKDIIAFYGGISTQHALPYGTEEEVYEEVKSTLEDLGPDTGLLLSGSQAIASDVPIKNVNALFTALNELTGAHYTLIKE